MYIENNKLKIKKEIRVPDTAGYCYMELKENKKYNKNALIFYFLGGIIFNFVLFAFLLLLTISTNNIFLKLICILNAIMNIYFALHNLIPSIEKSGSINDGLHAMYFNNDEEYLGTMFKLQKLLHFIEMGIELKDIDRKLFSKPQKFQIISDIQNALIYIDYLLEKEQYNEVNKYAKKVLEEAKELLSNQDIIIIKLQLISSMFSSDEDISKIEEIWDEDIKRYLDLMENVNPIFIGYNYLYAMLIEKNEDNSRKYLNKFQQLNKKNYKKYELVEVEKIINEVNERIKK